MKQVLSLPRRALIALAFSTSLAVVPTTAARASSATCHELAGGVIFKDMLYGVLTGAVISGLAMAAVKNYEHAGEKVAFASLAGAGVGVGVGVVELIVRDCDGAEVRKTVRPSSWAPQLAFVPSAGGREPPAFVAGLTYRL